MKRMGVGAGPTLILNLWEVGYCLEGYLLRYLCCVF